MGRSFRLVAVALLAVILTLSVTQNVFAATELYYDDGTWEGGWGGLAGLPSAVRFSLPTGWSSAKLLTAKYYLELNINFPQDNGFSVQVYDSDGVTQLCCTPTLIDHLAVDGWFSVDLSAYNIVVSGDFYVAMSTLVNWRPFLGRDTSSNAGRSFYKTIYAGGGISGWLPVSPGANFMIRAVVEQFTMISSTVSTTVVDSTSSSTTVSETSSSTARTSETSTTMTTVNPVSVTGTSWATTTVTGSIMGTTTRTLTSVLTTSTVVSSLSQQSSTSTSTETLIPITSTESSTIGTSTTTSLTTSTTSSGGTITERVTETDTIYTYLLLVYNELHTFVENVGVFLTTVFQQTETPLGVRINQIIVTVSPAPVGGCVQPVNTFGLIVPWIAAVGLLGCIGTAVVIAKKHKE